MGNINIKRSDRPELSERELSYITIHTKFTRKQIDEFFIRFLTFYPRGSVNFEQFCDLYSTELKHLYNSRPLLERLFRHIDTDKNGLLNFKEILFFKAVSLPETDDDEKLRWIFVLYDTNLDGYIDEYEFYDLCHLAYSIHGQLLTNNRLYELKILFRRSDTNYDRKLNCDEFIRLCQQCTDLLQLIAPMFKNTKWSLKKEHSPTSAKPTELTSDQIEYLMKRTKFTRERILNYYEIFREHCHAGQLSKDEFVKIYQKLRQSNIPETYGELLFQACDSILKDGFIQFDEYLIAVYIHSNSSTSREKLEWLYNAYDRDGDGFINYDELYQIVVSLFVLYEIDREKNSAHYVSYEIMSILDLNQDDKISKQEFINMLKDKELTSFLTPSLIKQR